MLVILAPLGYVLAADNHSLHLSSVASTQPFTSCLSGSLTPPLRPAGWGMMIQRAGGDLRADDGGNVGVVV
jgi:hypothetical protein